MVNNEKNLSLLKNILGCQMAAGIKQNNSIVDERLMLSTRPMKSFVLNDLVAKYKLMDAQ